MDDLKRLDLNLLICFEEIYSAGNVSQAARQMGITQPAMSNALNRLRGTLNDPLFTPIGRGIEPTPRARRLIGPVREALRLLHGGVTDVEQFDPDIDRRHFRIVLLDQLEPLLIAPLLRQLNGNRNVTIESRPVSNMSVVETLSDGHADLALSIFLKDAVECDCETVGAADIIVAARKNHPKIKGRMTKKKFSEINHVALVQKLRAMTNLDEALRDNDITRHIAYSIQKIWSMPYIIGNTDLIGMLPREFAEEMSKFYPLEIFDLPFRMPEQKIFMTWKKSRTADPANKWLRNCIRHIYQDSIQEI